MVKHNGFGYGKILFLMRYENPVSTARFCPVCGAKLFKDPPASDSFQNGKWEVFVGETIPDPGPDKKRKASSAVTVDKISAVKKRSPREMQNAPALSGPSLMPAAISQLLVNGFSGIQSLDTAGSQDQSRSIAVLVLAVIAGVSGFLAGRSRGLTSVITLISSVVLVLLQGGPLFTQVIDMIKAGTLNTVSNPMLAQLAGMGTSLAAALMAAKRK